MFLSLASIVADEMYQKPIPILATSPSDFETFRSGQSVVIEVDGTITIATVSRDAFRPVPVPKKLLSYFDGLPGAAR